MKTRMEIYQELQRLSGLPNAYSTTISTRIEALFQVLSDEPWNWDEGGKKVNP